MSWFKVDDTFADHPKVDALADGACMTEALSLWLLAGCWCAKQLQDGKVPRGRAARFGIERWEAAAAELVRVGLWELDGDGWRIHDWLVYQPSRADVETKRAKDAARKARGRAKESDSSPPDSPRGLRADSARTPDGTHGGQISESEPPDPTRPDPTLSLTRETRAPLPRGLDEVVRKATQRLLDEHGVATKSPDFAPLRGLTAPIWAELARWCTEQAAKDGVEPRDVVALVVTGWADDERVIAKGHPLSWLRQSPREWYIAGKRAEEAA